MTRFAIAAPYAKALSLLDANPEQLNKRLAILERIQQEFDHHPDFLALLEAPDRTLPEIEDALNIFVTNEDDPLLLQYLGFLFIKRRIRCLPEIIDVYRELVHELLNILAVRVISAAPLEPSIENDLETKIKTEYPDKKIEMTVEVDPSAIGGLAIILKGHVIDGTVRGKLAELKEKLLALPV